MKFRVEFDLSMKKDCSFCPCFEGERCTCQVTGDYVGSMTDSDCPLVPVDAKEAT